MWLTKKMIWDMFVSLSYSTGFYGRLCRDIAQAGEEGMAYLQELEDMHFTNDLDLIYFIEGNV